MSATAPMGRAPVRVILAGCIGNPRGRAVGNHRVCECCGPETFDEALMIDNTLCAASAGVVLATEA